MPPKRQNIGRRTRRANQAASARANEGAEQRAQRNNEQQIRRARQRTNQTEEEREIQNLDHQLRMIRNRGTRDRSDENRNQQNLNRRMDRQSRQNTSLLRAALHYDHEMNYSLHGSVDIGAMNIVCAYCKAMKFKNEAPGLCCFNGKVKLPPLNNPPEPLKTLVSGATPQSKHFMKNIQSYNSCFHFTSFGATKIERQNFMPTFKVSTMIRTTKIENGHYYILNDTPLLIRQNLAYQNENFTDTRPDISPGRLIVTTRGRKLPIPTNLFHG